MEIKKNPKANLENKRFIFFQIGLVFVLGITFMAFEMDFGKGGASSLGELPDMVIEEEIIPITRQQEIQQPPPPPVVSEVLDIVEDDVEIENEITIDDSEADETTEIQQVEIQEEEEVEEVLNFYVIEDKPEFPGGNEEALMRWIAQNTKYPEIAKENGIQGKVFVQFVIDKDGSVTNVEVMRGIDPYLDKEAIRVVNSMPKWKPGKQRGKPVKVIFQIPINFKLY